MLGVVRIYSRKSSVLLAGLAKIISMLSQSRSQSPFTNHHPSSNRLTTHSSTNTNSSKRPRDTDHAPQISLLQHHSSAHPDAITISQPSAKRRRTMRTTTSLAIPNQTFSEHSDWCPIATSPNDVLAAVTLLFPTVSVPQNGDQVVTGPHGVPLILPRSQQPSQSDAYSPPSVSHHERSVQSVPWSDARRAAFHAREEDIMLREPRLDDFLVEDPLHLLPSSGAQNVPTRFNDTPGPVRRLFYDSATSNENPVEQDSPTRGPPSVDAFEAEDRPIGLAQQLENSTLRHDPFLPLDLEPLQLSHFPTLITHRSNRQESSPKSHDDVPLSFQNQQPSDPVGDMSVTPMSPGHESNQNNPTLPVNTTWASARISPSVVTSPGSVEAMPLESEPGAQTSQGKKSEKKIKRAKGVIMDAKPEFDSSEFRALMLDPSDIVIPDGHIRPKGRRGQRTQPWEQMLWQTPSLIRRFAPEVVDIWRQVTDDGWGSPAISTPSSSENASGHARMGEQEWARGTIADAGTEHDYVEITQAQLDVNAQNVATGNGTWSITKQSSSSERMREGNNDEARSAPSVSAGVRSGSLSVPSVTLSGGNERDRLFDMVSFPEHEVFLKVPPFLLTGASKTIKLNHLSIY